MFWIDLSSSILNRMIIIRFMVYETPKSRIGTCIMYSSVVMYTWYQWTVYFVLCNVTAVNRERKPSSACVMKEMEKCTRNSIKF